MSEWACEWCVNEWARERCVCVSGHVSGVCVSKRACEGVQCGRLL